MSPGETRLVRTWSSIEGDDFRTALHLVAAGLGVALLPAPALTGAPAGMVGRPMRTDARSRSTYTCRLDTRRVAAPVERLEAYVRGS